MKLRAYQEDLVFRVRKSVAQGNKRVCFTAGCGAGKSIMVSDIAKGATDKGNQVLFLVHRKELCSQIESTFNKYGVNMNLCEIGMVQTVCRRLETTETPAIIIVDEAHHILSNSYVKIIEHFSAAIVVGCTATPLRMKEGGLGKVFDDLIVGVKTDWLIENKYLAPYRYFSLELADAKGIRTKMGDYDKKQVALLMEKAKIFGDTIKHWNKIAKGTKTIVYCASVEASRKTAEEFIKNGVKAYHLDGTTNKAEREEVVSKFKSGEITVLTNNDLFGEGFDVPDCQTVILLRPTKSLTIYIQQSMRSMRMDPNNKNKVALIIDHVGNVHRHGFPDEDREWDLKAKKMKRKGEEEFLVRQCQQCYSTYHPRIRVCPYCGYEMVNESRYKKEMVDYELVELKKNDKLKEARHDMWKDFTTFEQLKIFQKAKKYKFSWCFFKAKELGIRIPSKYDYMREKFMGG